jgi:hypothetical protein
MGSLIFKIMEEYYMPNVEKLTQNWFSRVLDATPSIGVFVPPAEQESESEYDISLMTSMAPTAFNRDIWEFVQEWLRANEPPEGEEIGYFDDQGVLHLTLSEGLPQASQTVVSLYDGLDWTTLDQVPIVNGVACVHKTINGLNLRGVRVGKSSVRSSVVA